jgi:hypothetical protein
MNYARYRVIVRELEFEVGNKYLLRELTGFLIHQKQPGLFTKIPMKIQKYEMSIKSLSKEVED